MNKTLLKYSLITGVSILLYSFVLQIIMGDINTLTASKLQLIEILSIVRYLIIAVCVFIGLKKYHEDSNNKTSFLSLTKQGVLASIIIGCFAGIYELFFMVQHPTFFEKYVELFLEQLKNNGTNQGGLDAAKTKLYTQEWLKTPWRTGIYYFVKASLMGIVVTLIQSMFIEAKRKRVEMELEDAKAE